MATNSIRSDALEPTAADLKHASWGARLTRLLPVYGLPILALLLIALFSIILPDTFDFVQSIAILTMVVIGGTGSVWGVVAATIGLTLLPEVSRAASDYRLLIFGAMLMLVMRFSPGGLAGLVKRRAAT